MVCSSAGRRCDAVEPGSRPTGHLTETRRLGPRAAARDLLRDRQNRAVR